MVNHFGGTSEGGAKSSVSLREAPEVRQVWCGESRAHRTVGRWRHLQGKASDLRRQPVLVLVKQDQCRTSGELLRGPIRT
jgi:hypothetical protein